MNGNSSHDQRFSFSKKKKVSKLVLPFAKAAEKHQKCKTNSCRLFILCNILTYFTVWNEIEYHLEMIRSHIEIKMVYSWRLQQLELETTAILFAYLIFSVLKHPWKHFSHLFIIFSLEILQNILSIPAYIVFSCLF